MPDVYFGADYPLPGYSNNNNWDDINQWWSSEGGSGEGGVYYGVLLGRFPNAATDTIRFRQAVLYNFPVTWTGTTIDIRLGSSIIPATGTWSGSHLTGSSAAIWGTSSTPVISGPIRGAGTYNGGLITGNFDTNQNSVFFNRDAVVTGNITNLGTAFVSNNVTISGNVSSSVSISGGTISGIITGSSVTISSSGTITGNINSRSVTIRNERVFGLITATNSFFLHTGTYGSVTLGPALIIFEMYGGSLPNITTITVSNRVIIQNASLPNLTTILSTSSAVYGSIDITNTFLPNATSIRRTPISGPLNITTSTLPIITTLKGGDTISLRNSTLPNVTTLSARQVIQINQGSLPNLTTIDDGAYSIQVENIQLNNLSTIPSVPSSTLILRQASLPSMTSLSNTTGLITTNSTLSNITSLNTRYISLTKSSIPNVTSIIASNFIVLDDIVTGASVRSNQSTPPSESIIRINSSTVAGNISFGNIGVAWLEISGRSVISADISTAVTNCARFTLTSGTFTHPNPWIFGTTSIAATIESLGSEVVYVGRFTAGIPPADTSTSYAVETLGTFNKDITIYTSATSVVRINYPRLTSGGLERELRRDTTFTGLISILPITGGRIPSITVGGGIYRPTKTVAAIASGTNYYLDATQLPYDWGFYRDDNPDAYSPTIYVSGIPLRFDVLSSGV